MHDVEFKKSGKPRLKPRVKPRLESNADERRPAAGLLRTWSPRSGRTFVTAVVVAALLAPILSLPVEAQRTLMTRQDYEACQARDEEGFRTAIERLTLNGLQSGLRTVDYGAVVAEAWRSARMDAVLDAQVDRAISEVSEENSYWDKATSIFSSEKAQAMAVTVADRVFKSQAMKTGIEQLAVAAGTQIGRQIEIAAADTAEPAMQCLQAFLGPRYGSMIARTVSRDASKEYSLDTRAQPTVTTGQILGENVGSIAGTIILIVRRQLASMARRVGARMVGSVLSRVVSVVAGGVGVVLIAKDIWDLRNGVLPIIASEMKSEKTKQEVRTELASAMREQIGENVREIASQTADRVVEVWAEFRRAHAKVLELAEKDESFKRFLDSLTPDALPRLAEAVGLLLAEEGEAGILRRLADGTLHTIVNVMPSAGFDIARETRSLEQALAWWGLAGESLPQVVGYEVYRFTKPETLTRGSLVQLLSIGERVAIGRVASLAPQQRAALLDLPVIELRNLGRSLTDTELNALSHYVTALEKGAAQRLLRAVSETPVRMQVLGRDGVRSSILASRDQASAVGMMLKPDGWLDPWSVVEHSNLAYEGRISPWLLWEKHPFAVGAAAMLVLAVLGFFKRLLFGRRPRVIVQHVPVQAPASPPVAPPPPRVAAPPIRSGNGGPKDVKKMQAPSS